MWSEVAVVGVDSRERWVMKNDCSAFSVYRVQGCFTNSSSCIGAVVRFGSETMSAYGQHDCERTVCLSPNCPNCSETTVIKST